MSETYDISSFGAVGDGMTDCTDAIQKALNKCHENNGGTIVLPPGVYLSGTLYLCSNIHIIIQENAILKAIPDKRRYNKADFTPQNYASVNEKTDGTHLLIALNVENITISGGGKIDGNYSAFFDPLKNTRADFPGLRPAQMLFFCESKNIKLYDVTLENAAYWSCFFYGCCNINVTNINIKTAPESWNGDGLDIDCCQNVTVKNCRIDTSDDCIAIRSAGSRLQNTEQLTSNIEISDCTLTSRQAAIRFGVGSGEIRRCRIKNINVYYCTLGITFHGHYSHSNNSGLRISDIVIDNVFMRSLLTPMCIMEHYALDVQDDGRLAEIRDIHISNMHGFAGATMLIQGDRDFGIKNITLENIEITLGGGDLIPESGNTDEIRKIGDGWRFYQPYPFAAVYAENLTCRNVRFHWSNEKTYWHDDNIILPENYRLNGYSDKWQNKIFVGKLINSDIDGIVIDDFR